MTTYFLKLNDIIKKLILFVLFVFGIYLLFHNYVQISDISYASYFGALSVFGLLTYLVSKVATRYEVSGVLMIISFAFIFYGFMYDDNQYSDSYSSFINFIKVTTIFFAYLLVFLFFIIHKFEWYPKFIFGEPLKEKMNLSYKKMRDIVEKNRDALEQIEVFTISNIGKKYKALSMVESTEADKDDALIALRLQASRLEADAIVNIVSSSTISTHGNIKADTILSPGGGGSINTSIMHHYEGTAVKYLD